MLVRMQIAEKNFIFKRYLCYRKGLGSKIKSSGSLQSNPDCVGYTCQQPMKLLQHTTRIGLASRQNIDFSGGVPPEANALKFN